MPDTRYSLKEALKKGIRSSYKVDRTDASFEKVVNAKAQKEGLYPFEPINIAFTGADQGVFPQIFRTKTGTYVVTEDKLYSTNEGSYPWTLTEVTVSVPWGTSTTIPAGGRWHIADFVSGFILYNGACEIIKYRGQYMLNSVSNAKTGCYFRGRLFVGGLSKFMDMWQANNYSNATFASGTSMLDTDMEDNWVGWTDPRGWDILGNLFPHMLLTGGSEGIYRTTLMPTSTGSWTVGAGWSAATGPRFTGTSASSAVTRSLSLGGATKALVTIPVSRSTGSITVSFSGGTLVAGNLSISTSGYYGFLLSDCSANLTITLTGTGFTGVAGNINTYRIDQDIDTLAVNELIKTNARGFMPMNWDGNIVRVEPLEDAVIVYGTKNITALIPREETFERKEIAQFGVIGRSAVSGGFNSHLFIDSYGRAQILNNQLQVIEIDRRELFDIAITENKQDEIIAMLDAYDGHFFVTVNRSDSDDDRSYSITDTGVTELGAAFTDIIPSGLGIGNVGFAGAIRTSKFELTTLRTNFGTPTIKLFKTLVITLDDSTGLRAKLLFRKGKSAPIKETEWKYVDGRGEVDFFESGIDFQIQLEADDYTAIRIHDMEVIYSIDAETNIREHLRRY
jgi:hypothetical protein